MEMPPCDRKPGAEREPEPVPCPGDKTDPGLVCAQRWCPVLCLGTAAVFPWLGMGQPPAGRAIPPAHLAQFALQRQHLLG